MSSSGYCEVIFARALRVVLCRRQLTPPAAPYFAYSPTCPSASNFSSPSFKYASDVGYLIESASGSSYIMIGTKLAHYEITQHLGSGGMGDVYQATDSRLDRSVAIKFLPEAFSHDGERVARFEREARAGVVEPSSHRGHLRTGGIRRTEVSGHGTRGG